MVRLGAAADKHDLVRCRSDQCRDRLARALDRLARRPAFQPYGIDPDIPDPVARALTGLLDEVATLRARLNELEAEQAAGAEAVEAPAPERGRRRVARANP